MSTLRDRARGRWEEILVEKFNLDPRVLNPRRHFPCPSCGGEDRFRYKGDEDGGYFCGSRRGDGIDLVMHITGLDFQAAAKAIEEVVGRDDSVPDRPPNPCEPILARAKPLRRSKYLESRGIYETDGLLCVTKLAYFDDGKQTGEYPAIVAPLKRGGKVIALQVLYLDGGRKAPVPSPKKIISGPTRSINGAAVELAPFKGGRLGIAEGFETAMSAAALHGIPVWAALSTSGMKSWQWPQGVEEIVIFADNDPKYAGHAAAWHLAHRVACENIPVRVMMPEKPGTDWNDVLQEKLKCSNN